MKLISIILTLFLSFFAPLNLIGTNPDPADAEIMARCMWGECRGMPSTAEKAAVAWCILNRVDDERWPNTIKEVITQPSQFTGYLRSNPVDEELLWIANDVLERWEKEKAGEEDVGRVLPREYCFFVNGYNGHNNFGTSWPIGRKIWDWSLPDPYEERIEENDEFDPAAFQIQYRQFDGMEDGTERPWYSRGRIDRNADSFTH